MSFSLISLGENHLIWIWRESQVLVPSSRCLTLWRLVGCGPRGVFRGQVAAAAWTSQSLFTLLDIEGSRDNISVCHTLHHDIHCKRSFAIVLTL